MEWNGTDASMFPSRRPILSSLLVLCSIGAHHRSPNTIVRTKCERARNSFRDRDLRSFENSRQTLDGATLRRVPLSRFQEF